MIDKLVAMKLYNSIGFQKKKVILYMSLLLNASFLLLIKSGLVFNSKTETIILENSMKLGTMKEKRITEMEEKLEKGFYMYIWTDFCQESLDILKTWPLFPYYPIENIERLQDLNIRFKQFKNSAQRIFGLLIPPKSGSYFFKKNKENLEMWIHEYKTHSKMTEIFKNDKIVQIRLKSNTLYHVEIFNTVPKGYYKSVNIQWRIPGDCKYRRINDTSMFTSIQMLNNGTRHLNDLMVHFKPQLFEGQIEIAPKNQLYKLNTIPLKGKIYKDCEYSPSFAIKRKLKKDGGIHVVEEMVLSVYPDNKTSFGGRIKGNDLVNENEVNIVYSEFKKHTMNKFGIIKEMKLANLEKQTHIKASRYLIETEVTLHSEPSKNYKLSYHIYTQNESPYCHPSPMNINMDVYIHLLLTVKNQAHWLRYFIEMIERIYNETKDEKFDVIIVDSGSEDINVAKLVEESSFTNIDLITIPGAFYKTKLLNIGLNHVQDMDEIILVLDLHVEIPVDLLDVTRTHTFKGVAAFAPRLFRLKCGYTQQYVSGVWEKDGYGIVALYKSDWNILGGYNEEKYTYGHGGEDWEFLDRLLENGYYLERFNLPNMFHYFHSRKQTWDGRSSNYIDNQG